MTFNALPKGHEPDIRIQHCASQSATFCFRSTHCGLLQQQQLLLWQRLPRWLLLLQLVLSPLINIISSFFFSNQLSFKTDLCILRIDALTCSHIFTKGQIISECPYEIIVPPKIPTKISKISALASKERSNQKLY